jgi:hypothetical protein
MSLVAELARHFIPESESGAFVYFKAAIGGADFSAAATPTLATRVGPLEINYRRQNSWGGCACTCIIIKPKMARA